MTTKNTSIYDYQHGDQLLRGYIAYPADKSGLSPAVLVVHDWSGCNAFARQQADMLAKLGYVALAVDMYGDGRTGETAEEKLALMQPVLNNRLFLRARIQAAMDAVKNIAQVDSQRVAVIGFCFGGLCALDLARSGADIRGAVSFHGILDKPAEIADAPIRAKILALHGYDDPLAKPDQVQAFCQEMTDAKVDWQVHMYGLTQHSFTNPQANDSAMGLVYNASVSRRAFQSMTDFLREVF
jgi:dienelactone hydrolase